MNRFQLCIVAPESWQQAPTSQPSIMEVGTTTSGLGLLTVGQLRKQVGVAVHYADQLGARVWTMQKGLLRDVQGYDPGGDVGIPWEVGDTIWADANGLPTAVEPPATRRRVKLGTCFKKSTLNGQLQWNYDGHVFIDVEVYPGFDDLPGVSLTNPAPPELPFFTDLGGGLIGLANRLIDHGDDPDPASLLDDDHRQYVINPGLADPSVFEMTWEDVDGFGNYGALTVEVQDGIFYQFASRGIYFEGSGVWQNGDGLTNVNPAEGPYLYYLNQYGNVEHTDDLDDETIVGDAAPFLSIWWDEDYSGASRLTYKNHGRDMDKATRRYIQKTIGMVCEPAITLTDILADEDGSLDTHAQLGIGGGALWDADLKTNVDSIVAPAAIPKFYRLGANGYYRREDMVDPWDPITTEVVLVAGSGRAAWNKDTGGTWSLDEIPDYAFGLMHYFASPDMVYPVFAVVGLGIAGSLDQAQGMAANEVAVLKTHVRDNLVREAVYLGTIIVQTSDDYANSVKTRIVSTMAGADYLSGFGEPETMPTQGSRDVTGDDYPSQYDFLIRADATGAALTVYLPDPAQAQFKILHVKKVDATTNAVTVDAATNGGTIDGENTFDLSAEGECLSVHSNGTLWTVI